jgi:secreted trypsin-like serine protease
MKVQRISPPRGFAILAGCIAALLAAVPTAGASPRARASVIPGPSSRVASLTDWGFTVGVRSSIGLCTGVVVGPIKVLTAAHCLDRPVAMQVIANRVSLGASGGETVGVQGFASAPRWSSAGFANDLAVLTLSAPTSAPPIRLATAQEDAAYTADRYALETAGFGMRNPFMWGKPKVGLLTASPALVSSAGCGPVYNPALMICDRGPRSQWIAISGRKRRSIQSAPCEGDSGGPLIARTPTGPVLIGLTEAGAQPTKSGRFYGVLCGLRGYNTIHTRLAPYLSFIVANL